MCRRHPVGSGGRLPAVPGSGEGDEPGGRDYRLERGGEPGEGRRTAVTVWRYEMTTTSKPFYNPEAKFKFTTKDVEYLRHGNNPLLARIYKPEGDGPFPAIMDIHGGAWTTGDRLQNTLIDEMMCETGMVVVALDFRLSPQHPYPAQVQDINF